MTSSCSSLLLLFLLFLSSSSSTTEDLSRKNSDFAARLFRAVCSRTDDNVVLSPLALSGGLTALLSAATGTTQQQLLSGLSLNGLQPDTLPDLFQTLRTAVQSGGGGGLHQAVGLFPPQDFQPSSSYLQLLQEKFGAQSRSVSFSAPSDAVSAVNLWAQEQTGDRVRDLVTALQPDTRLLLATAAAFQAQFSPSFNASLSQDERFYVDKYHVAMVTMMFRAGKYFLAYDGAVKSGVLKLPLSDGAAMLVLLPDEDVDVRDLEDQVTGDKITGWISMLKKTKLEVQLPRFVLERSYSLKDVLQTLDITQVFQDDAEITNMGGTKAPPLSQVVQKTSITVDERSDDITTEGGVSGVPPRLTINRPFIFIVYHEATGSLLLIGRVVDPTKK